MRSHLCELLHEMVVFKKNRPCDTTWEVLNT